MRVSTTQIFSLSLNQINSSLNDVTLLNVMTASQKKVNSPSDDPAGSGKIVELSSYKNSLTGYKDNCDVASEYLETADDVLSDASEQITAALEVVEQASTETYTTTQLQQMAIELESYLDSLYTIANTQMGDDYVFAGDDTGDNAYELGLGVTIPNDELSSSDIVSMTGDIDSTIAVQITSDGTVGTDAISYQYSTDYGETWTTGTLAAGDTTLDLGDVQVELASGTTVTTTDDDEGTQFYVREAFYYTGSDEAMSVNISDSTDVDMTSVGSDIFGGIDSSTGEAYDNDNLFEVIADCIVYMEQGDSDAVEECLELLEDAQETVTTAAANVGARENKCTAVGTALTTVSDLTTDSISNIEDADSTQLVVELEAAEYVYEAVLQSSASLMSMSLLDYI